MGIPLDIQVTCPICGKEFTVTRLQTTKKYCSRDCSKTATNERGRERRAVMKDYGKTQHDRDNMSALRRMAAEAADNGMSYGKWTARIG